MRRTSNRELLVLGLATILIVLTMWAIAIRAEDFFGLEMNCPEAKVCPKVPVCSAISEWDIDLRAAEENPLDVITLRLSFGEQIVDRTIGCCVVLTGITTDSDGFVSEPVHIIHGGGECQPVPEPGLGVGLMAGVLWLAWRRR